MSLTILYRTGLSDSDKEELAAIQEAGIPISFSRSDPILNNSVVVGRYSVLPYYNEVVRDLNHLQAHLVNTSQTHHYIANMEYVHDLQGLTPTTWFRVEDIPSWYQGSFFIKGTTNSKKSHSWNKYCFASSRQELPAVVARLEQDTFYASQGIVVREFVPLETYGVSVTEQPITNEWRAFCLTSTNGQHVILASGYYWSPFLEETEHLRPKEFPKEAEELVMQTLQKLAYPGAFVVDVAKTIKGNWIVVELNDAQMSGLSAINPLAFYANLQRIASQGWFNL